MMIDDKGKLVLVQDTDSKKMVSHAGAGCVFWKRYPKTLSAKSPDMSKDWRVWRQENLPELMKAVRLRLNDSKQGPLGGRLKMYTNRWRPLKGSMLVSQGIVARFINRDRGIVELSKQKYYSEFHGTPLLQKIFDEQMQDWINNGVFKQTPYEEFIYINPTHLVPKANGKIRLVTDMCVVNSYMRKIHFKMENIIAVEELMQENDYAILRSERCILPYSCSQIIAIPLRYRVEEQMLGCSP
jgi:hypothetical protein